jgi:hypothetical protein
MHITLGTLKIATFSLAEASDASFFHWRPFTNELSYYSEILLKKFIPCRYVLDMAVDAMAFWAHIVASR